MAKSAATLIFGVTLGIVGVFVYNRLREVVEEEDSEALIDRISRQIEVLDIQLGNGQTGAGSK